MTAGPLARYLPASPPWAALGRWPTPIDGATGALADRVWWKREDLAHPTYGGNKLRTLEAVLGDVLDRGGRAIWATGAYGSNHTLATALHAPRVGLAVGCVVFPQPVSDAARANLSALITTDATLVRVASVAALPWTMWRLARAHPDAHVMSPGGATPVGAAGALGAALETVAQIAAGAMPAPARVVVPVGSGCTTAGLLAGFQLARSLGLAASVPQICAVRVTPWPITARWRLAHLARATWARLAADFGAPPPPSLAQLAGGLEVWGESLGPGYGHPTATGVAAAAWAGAAGAPPLDLVYAAKAGASLRARDVDGPTLFWVTKSSAPLPEGPPRAALDPHLARWLAR